VGTLSASSQIQVGLSKTSCSYEFKKPKWNIDVLAWQKLPSSFLHRFPAIAWVVSTFGPLQTPLGCSSKNEYESICGDPYLRIGLDRLCFGMDLGYSMDRLWVLTLDLDLKF
jgi:hypothetical protein